MATTKSKRALVIVSFLSSDHNFNFYNFIESSGIATAELFLKNKYKTVAILKDSNATKSKFLSKLSALASDASIKAIDVIMMTHGSFGKLYFFDSSVSNHSASVRTSILRDEIKSLNISNKLRLLYSTACYGDSHSHDFLDAGFKASVGSKKINANAATEFPLVCNMWGNGDKIKDAIFWGEFGYEASDLIARAAGFSPVNSDKDVEGRQSLRITS